MSVRQVFSVLLLIIPFIALSQKRITLNSPEGNIRVSIQHGDSIYYEVEVNGRTVIAPSTIALLTDHGAFGVKPAFSSQKTRSVRDSITNPVPFKRKRIPDRFNEITLRYRGNFSLIFRAYDDGIAYRIASTWPDSLQILGEVAKFNFRNPADVYFPEVTKRENVDIYHTSFEEPYKIMPLREVKRTQMGFSPVLVDDITIKTLITESDLSDYPGMFLKGVAGNGLQGEFAPYPASEEIQGGEFKQWVVLKRRNFIAKTHGTRNFPWRVIGISQKDADLLLNDLVYRLATPAAPQDWSWIKPGISTEEWIIGSNLSHVDFKTGINTATYKYYIDFASRFGLKFVMLDAGWSDADDLLKITPGLDLRAVADYAKTKNVDLILWTLSMTLDRQLDKALDMFSSLGIKGILTDFMDRDDQKTVAFYHRIARATAQKKMMVMFHGAFKNAGLERTFPNVITREAVLGSEYNIWSEKATPEHDLLLPFIRMVAGPMDYEPGSYRNANQRTFRSLPDMVMSQGTRVHQLAMLVTYESPLQMFSGNPADGYREPEYTAFMGSLPTTWDDTRVLHAKLGDYLVIARRKGNDWYIGGMTDWTARALEIDMSFLASGEYNMATCEDGINAVKDASDYRMENERVDKSKKVVINMAPGGGYVAKLTKLNDARR